MFFPIINELQENWSSLQIQCNKLFSWEQVNGLKNESIDVVIGLDFPHWDKSGFIVNPLKENYYAIKFDGAYTDSYVCVVNPENNNPVIKLFLDLIDRYKNKEEN